MSPSRDENGGNRRNKTFGLLLGDGQLRDIFHCESRLDLESNQLVCRRYNELIPNTLADVCIRSLRSVIVETAPHSPESERRFDGHGYGIFVESTDDAYGVCSRKFTADFRSHEEAIRFSLRVCRSSHVRTLYFGIPLASDACMFIMASGVGKFFVDTVHMPSVNVVRRTSLLVQMMAAFKGVRQFVDVPVAPTRQENLLVVRHCQRFGVSLEFAFGDTKLLLKDLLHFVFAPVDEEARGRHHKLKLNGPVDDQPHAENGNGTLLRRLVHRAERTQPHGCLEVYDISYQDRSRVMPYLRRVFARTYDRRSGEVETVMCYEGRKHQWHVKETVLDYDGQNPRILEFFDSLYDAHDAF